MPVYQVNAPDGKKYKVNAPDGASQDDAIAYVQKNFYSVQPEQSDPFAEVAKEQSFGKNLIVGVGGGMKSLALGAGQRLGLVDQKTIDDHKRAMQGLEYSAGGTIGNIAGQAVAAAPLALVPGANTMLGAALTGGAVGLAQPTGENGSVIANAAIGAGGSMVGKALGDKLIKALKGTAAPSKPAASASVGQGSADASATVNGSAQVSGSGGGYNFGAVGPDASAGLSNAQASALETGKSLGFKVTPGQATGSKSLQMLEAKLESQPMTAGTFNDIKASNQKVLNGIAAKSIGEDATELSSPVLERARDRISGVYKMVADKTPRPIDPDNFLNQLASIEGNYEGLMPGSIIDNPLVKRLFKYAENGKATGEQLQDIASKLGKAAHNNMTAHNGDRQIGMALNDVKEIADDLLESSLQGKTAEAFREARGQYRNLMLLTQRQGVVNPSSGDVKGNALASLLQQKDRPGFLFNKNNSDLYNAARFSQAFQPIVGNSGTATRSPLPSPTDFVLSLPFSMATKAYASSPAVNLSVAASNASRNGINRNLGMALDPYGRQGAALFGGLLGANTSN